jgi:antitoxin VapB
MALHIKNAQADELARALAACTGQSITDAVVNALREQLKRETGRRLAPRLAEELRAISERCAALPDHDKRSSEEIIGFDEHGLPV